MKTRLPESGKSERQCLRIIPLLVIMGMIFYLSHQEGGSFSLPAIPYVDKLGHFFLYAVLAGTALFAFPAKQRQVHPLRTAAVVMVFCLVYAVTDEVHQAFIPGRDASIFDLGADFAGAALTVFSWYRRPQQKSFLSIHSLHSGGIHQDT